MDVAARLTSKGQVTLPKAVREAFGLREGDRVVFRVEGSYASLAVRRHAG
jgi:AbrB family looped-hinge helix DNA binding protein